MRKGHAYLLFMGTLLTAAAYGATFLLTEHFRALGGSEIETGTTLGAAMLGTFVGLPLVGWLNGRLGAATLASIGALAAGLGFLMLSLIGSVSSLPSIAGFWIGLGWGVFYLAAPMALSTRVSQQERGFWFLRFGAFQMAGIGGSPVIAGALKSSVGLSTAQIFFTIACLCVVAAALVAAFEWLSPHLAKSESREPDAGWLFALPTLARSRAIYPILMVGCGACVFSGLLTFQTSLVRQTTLQPETFFAVYSITVVAGRFVLAPFLARGNISQATIWLLVAMISGILAAFGLSYGLAVQVASALLVGAGYGLVYSLIQTQAVNDAPKGQKENALTWFVIAYFVGAFGFPMLGGWLIVRIGNTGFLLTVLFFALCELGLALLRYHRGPRLAAEERSRLPKGHTRAM